jgi:hypothetical protein
LFKSQKPTPSKFCSSDIDILTIQTKKKKYLEFNTEIHAGILKIPFWRDLSSYIISF